MSTPMSHFELLASIATTQLDQPIDGELLHAGLSKPPFVNGPGYFNVRDVGDFAPGYVKPRLVFRSGMLDFIPEANRASLRNDLGLANIFDFRRDDEVKIPPNSIDGIELVSCPYMDGKAIPPEFPPALFVLQDGDTVGDAYREMYDVILQGYVGGFRQVFEALKTAKEGEAVLFHCAGGKDRTGVMAALILDLMGAPAEVIADEYALTRIGTEPFREKLLPALIRTMVPSGEDAINTPQSKEHVGIDSPGLRHHLGSLKAVMMDFVVRLKSKYGGAEGYMNQLLGFTQEDIEQIRNNLRPQAKGE